jgi:hypothetical protein
MNPFDTKRPVSKKITLNDKKKICTKLSATSWWP